MYYHQPKGVIKNHYEPKQGITNHDPSCNTDNPLCTITCKTELHQEKQIHLLPLQPEMMEHH